MKLTEITVDGFDGQQRPGQTHSSPINAKLRNLSSGLNVVLGSADTRRCLSEFIRDVLFGGSHWNGTRGGHLNVQAGGHHYQLTRQDTTQAKSLLVSDLQGGSAGHRTPDFLSQVDVSMFEHFFKIEFNRLADTRSFVSTLLNHFEVGTTASGTMPFEANQTAYQAWRTAAEARLSQLDSFRQRIETLTHERTQLNSAQSTYNHANVERLAIIERELTELQRRTDTLSASLQSERQMLADLDRQIEELVRHIEREQANVQHVPVNHSQPDYLALYYERLDEIDNQIRRWRSVQSDIQTQRLRLRDEMVANGEMTIDSNEHPYHEARDILNALESKVDRTEEIARTWEHSMTPVENSRRMGHLCQEMRDDLQALCNELGRQYKHVRHKAAVAELKQLRRCYHEMDENVKRLLTRRETVISDIRQVDPMGAEAIVQSNQQFALCAEQEGHLVARQRFVTGSPLPQHSATVEYRTVYPDLTAEQNRLRDLRLNRTHNAQRITNLETELAGLHPERQRLIDERNRLGVHEYHDYGPRIREIDLSLSQLQMEMQALQQQVELDRPWVHWKPNYLLTNANRYLTQLTDGRLTQILLDRINGISVGQPNMANAGMPTLSENDQVLVRLSLAMSAVDQFALRGIRLPVVIDEWDQNLVPTQFMNALASFVRNGHQVIVMSSNRARVEQGNQVQAMVFELPDTNIVTPAYTPDYPVPSRQDIPIPPSAPDMLRSAPPAWPRTPVPAVNPSMAWRPETQVVTNLNTVPSLPPTPVMAMPRDTINRNTMLQDIDLVESIYLTPVESLGVVTVGQLLDMDLSQQEPDLIRRGFNLEQLDRWQAQAWLVISMPEMTTSDARILIGSGIDQPEQLLQLSESEILDRVRRYLDSPSGRRSNVSYSSFSSQRIRGWQDRLKSRNDWRGYTRSYRRSHNPRTRSRSNAPVSSTPIRRTPAPQVASRPTATTSRPTTTTSRPTTTASRRSRGESVRSTRSNVSRKSTAERYRYYLNRSDDIEAAPSIGPKTAEKFYAIGIETVEDFLNGDATDMAAQISNRRMSAKVITAWQNQTRLMCSVPNLRGHDVQILVGCGITEASQLAAKDPESLLGTVTPFVATKEGTRILRNGKKPDLDEMHEWIDAANWVQTTRAA